MRKYKLSKMGDFWYIKKKVLWWWVKVPDTGLGWRIPQMSWTQGCSTESEAQRILDEYYTNI